MNSPENNSSNSPNKRFKAGRKTLAAGFALLATVVPVASAEASATSDHSSAKIEVAQKGHIREFTELPGYGVRNTKEKINSLLHESETLSRSTIKIMVRDKGSDGPWQYWCDGLKTNAGVETAAHCFSEATGSDSDDGYIEFSDPSITAEDFANLSTKDYLVGDRLVDHIVAQDGEAGDNALLHPGPVVPGLDKVTPYDSIPTSPYETDAHPVPGEPVVMVTRPAANNFKKTTHTGVYIGSYVYKGANKRVVAITVKNEQQNPCTPGGSGGPVLGGNHKTIGNISFAMSTMDPSYRSYFEKDIAKQTGVDTGMATDICVLNAPSDADEAAAQAAFGHYATSKVSN